MKELIIKEILDPELERMITKEEKIYQLFDLNENINPPAMLGRIE